MHNWTPPAHWHKITTVDAHTGGEPFRIITSGLPALSGDTILAKRRYAKENLDHLRKALMWEPRGHADMYGCIVTEAVTPTADFGVLFLHNEGFSSMCGHGIIAMTTVAVETGFVLLQTPETIVKIDTPAGLVTARARIKAGRVTSVAFRNVPSFVLALDQWIEAPAWGRVRYDLAFGGAFYAYVQASEIGLTCTPADYGKLIEAGKAIKQAVMDSRAIPHPFEPDLSFLYGVIFVGAPHSVDAHSANVCVFADGEVDRSPTGTGVSGRLALHFARDEIALNQPIVIESIIGSRFIGQVAETTTFGPYAAIIPEVEGVAHICGRCEFLIDPEDELRHGFLLR